MTDRYAETLGGDRLAPGVAGGKGAALDELISLGANVPATGVITTAAYRAFAGHPEIAAFLDRLRAAPIPEPRRHEHERRRVDEAFLAIPMPQGVARAVGELAARIAGGGLLAVRSSATAEDLESASFAGQYESYLNVDAEGLGDAVRRVWASLWYPAPREYRRLRGIADDALGMAVLVMRMLDPTEAGVLFTVDPGGAEGAVRLEVVQGLGEQLVSGAATPDAYVVPRREIAARFGAISPPLEHLATEALRLEEALGAPQDIEFAVHGGRLYLLQARPITTAAEAPTLDDGFDCSCGPGGSYTTAGIAEMLPGVLPPLSWTINSSLVEDGFRDLFALLGGGADALVGDHVLLGRFRGRAALNLGAMRAAADSVPGGSGRELERRYFGEAVPSGPAGDAPPEQVGSSSLHGLRVLRARRQAVERSEVTIQAVRRTVASEPDLAQLPDAELLAYWRRVLSLAHTVVAAEIAVAAMAAALYRGVEVFLARYLDGSEAAVAAQTLTCKDRGEGRSRIALALEPVVEALRADPELAAAAVEDWEQARARLQAAPGGERLLDDFRARLRRAGSTSLFAGPTWDEVPHLAWMTVHQELTAPSQVARGSVRSRERRRVEQALVAQPRWRWARFATGQVMDVRRRFLRREAADAAEFLRRREQAKAAVLVLGGTARRVHLEAGRRLTARGRLDSAEDVELLGAGELGLLSGGPGPTPETIAQRRRRHLEARQAQPLPLRWTGEPAETPPPPVDGERFAGWSAGPGRFEGRARVVDAPGTSALRRGEILVASTTDASWAPLFTAAGAIVVEQGGPLSHAAIVARELGMPAVVNVPGVVDRLRRLGGSAPVVVDGSAGVVTILAEGDAPIADEDGAASDGPPEVGEGIVPTRAPDPRWDETGTRTNVFVAGLIGAGALMSVVMGLVESISSTGGRERLRAWAAPTAEMIAAGTTSGYGAASRSAVGLRPRSHYLAMAVALLAVAAIWGGLSLESVVSDGSAELIFGAVGLSGAAVLTVMGAALGGAVLGYPRVPAVVRRLLPRRRSRVEWAWAAVSPVGRRAVVAMLAVVAALGVLVVAAEDVLLKIDDPVYFDWLEAGGSVERWGPDWLILLGRPEWVIPMAALIGLVTLRHRVVAIAYPLVIVVGGLTSVTLAWATHRLRPPFSGHAGEYNSFPSGHSLQVTLLLGMLPLVAMILTRRVWVRNLVALLAGSVWAVAWIDTLRTGGHWPSDQLAGLLIAVSLLVVVYGVAARSVARDDPTSPVGGDRR